jgi:hypothetical protein
MNLAIDAHYDNRNFRILSREPHALLLRYGVRKYIGDVLRSRLSRR